MQKQISSTTILIVLIASLFGFEVYKYVKQPTINPDMPIVKYDETMLELGKKYGPVVTGTLGDSWVAQGEAVRRGGTMSDAMTKLHKDWQSAREAVFMAKIAPELNKTLPVGTEPNTPEQREAIANKMMSIGAGLKQDAKATRRYSKIVSEEYEGSSKW